MTAAAGGWHGLVYLGLLAAVLAGCGFQEHQARVASSPSSASAAPSGSIGDGDGGITASEAKQRGVFVAPFDAKLQDIQQDSSRVRLHLVNVGTKNDSYRLTLKPASAGTVTPAAPAVAAGKSANVTVTLTGAAVLHVMSAGRGAEVAGISLAPPR